MSKFNNPQKFLFSLSMISFSFFAVISAMTLFNGKVPNLQEGEENASILGAVSDKQIRLNYYIGTDYKNPLIEEVTQGNLISAFDQKVLVNLTDSVTLVCNDCSFSYSDEFGLSILNGIGYVENKGETSIELVFEREVLTVTPNTKLIYDYENKEVFVVSGALSTRSGQIIEKDQKYIFLVDKFYLRESDLLETENSMIRDLGYFLYDINMLPTELTTFQPQI